MAVKMTLVREPVGFMVMSQLKTTKDIYAWYPLAYGRDDEENKYVLLRDRAATLFRSEEAARQALIDTCMEETSKGSDWPFLYSFSITPVYQAPTSAVSDPT